MKKSIFFLVFLLILKISYAFDYSLFYTDVKYFAPVAVLLLFFLLFFLFRKRLRKRIVQKKEEPEQPLIKPMIHRQIPEERVVTKRPGNWKRDMKFTFTNFHGIPSKEHIDLKKKSSVFDKLSNIIKSK